MSLSLLLSLSTLIKISIGGLTVCYECKVEPSGMCCFDGIECGDPLCDPNIPEPTTTDSPNDLTTTQDPNNPTTTEDPNGPTTTDPNDSTTTEDPNITTEEPSNPPRDPGICKYWSSASNYEQQIVGGTPLDVCIGAFSGTELTSTSYIYKCSDDNTTVEYWWFTGSSDCNAEGTATESTLMNWNFDPLTDAFECRGDPCPHFIVMDATSHPTQTCPYDTGKNYGIGEDDYSTWHEKVILQGCQSFDGSTSFALKCSDSGGISQLNYDNTECDSSGLIGEAQMLPTATVECNYGTGRSVSCANGITSRNRHFAYNDPNPFGNTNTPTDTTTTGGNSTVGTGSTRSSVGSNGSNGNVCGIYQAILYVLGIFVYMVN